MIETYRGAIYPWHCDQMGHMNVMWYVGKFDEASWNLFAAMGVSAAFLRERNRRMAAVQQDISRRELHAGETVSVQSAFLKVHIDAKTRKSCAFPEDILARARGLVRAYSPPA
jgi:acyl-CoA thioester hydrolase